MVKVGLHLNACNKDCIIYILLTNPLSWLEDLTGNTMCLSETADSVTLIPADTKRVVCSLMTLLVAQRNGCSKYRKASFALEEVEHYICCVLAEDTKQAVHENHCKLESLNLNEACKPDNCRCRK